MESPETSAPAAAPPSGPAAASVASVPQAYELSQRTLFSGPEFRRLRADYEEIRRGCAMRLAVLFRTEVDFTLAALRTPTFRQFAGALEQPTHLTLVKVEPLRGIGVLEINPALGLTLTDRLMGGPGDAAQPGRELTEIEVALLDQVAHLLTEAWCGYWPGRDFKSTLLGHESDGRYLQTSPSESPLLVAQFEMKIGEAAGRIQLALPLTTLDPILQRIRVELKPPVDAPAPQPVAAKTPAWNPALDEVELALNAQLPGPQVTAREIPRLKVGDVLHLPVEAANLVRLQLGGKTRFTGRLGTRDDRWAVEILRVLKT
jgi:flagellar motor switch protein FliM